MKAKILARNSTFSILDLKAKGRVIENAHRVGIGRIIGNTRQIQCHRTVVGKIGYHLAILLDYIAQGYDLVAITPRINLDVNDICIENPIQIWVSTKPDSFLHLHIQFRKCLPLDGTKQEDSNHQQCEFKPLHTSKVLIFNLLYFSVYYSNILS